MQQEQSRAHRQSPSNAWMRCILAFACALAVTLSSAVLLSSVVFPGEAQAASTPSKIRYEGSELGFLQEDLETDLGMFSNPSGDMVIEWRNGEIHISFTPNNRNVFMGFYLRTTIAQVIKAEKAAGASRVFYPVEGIPDDKWIGAVGKIGEFSYDFSLSSNYAGYAWPIAPIEAPDRERSTTRSQYYLAVPALKHVSGYLHTVTFTDGEGNEISSQKVVDGEAAKAPKDPKRDGYAFAGWNRDFSNVTSDITVKARWLKDGTYATVEFVDGSGAVLKTEIVEKGGAATAPDDPVRKGYVFVGWDPADFDKVTKDLTVTAQWMTEEEAAVDAVRRAIAGLPANPKTLLRQIGDEAVTSAVDAYLALADDSKARLADSDRLHLAKCAIAVLPSDPFAVTADHEGPVSTAQQVVDTLSDKLRKALDSKTLTRGRSYGRYLENVAWAFDALKPVDNATSLPDGTYTGQVKSASSAGKANARQSQTFTVRSVTVKDGAAMALLLANSNAPQVLHLGGQEYVNLQADESGKSYFEVPLNLNSTFHFSVKGRRATEETDAVSYEMTVTADEAVMRPDSGSSDSPAIAPVVPSSDSDSSSDSEESSPSSSLSIIPTAPSGGAGAIASAGNLSSLVSNGSQTASATTPTRTGTASSQAGSQSPLSSSSAKEPTSASSARSGTSASTSALNGGVGASNAGVVGVTGVDSAIGLSAGAPAQMREDVAPAVAGLAILFISLGVLVFTRRFVKNESSYT